MKPYLGRHPATWSIGRSIILEMETFLNFALNQHLLPGLTADIVETVNTIPKDWLQAWEELWGKSENYRYGLEIAARIAGTIEVDDNGRGGLAIRG